MVRAECDDECEGIEMGAGVNNCGNGIKGLEAILEKIKKENADED